MKNVTGESVFKVLMKILKNSDVTKNVSFLTAANAGASSQSFNQGGGFGGFGGGLSGSGNDKNLNGNVKVNLHFILTQPRTQLLQLKASTRAVSEVAFQDQVNFKIDKKMVK